MSQKIAMATSLSRNKFHKAFWSRFNIKYFKSSAKSFSENDTATVWLSQMFLSSLLVHFIWIQNSICLHDSRKFIIQYHNFVNVVQIFVETMIFLNVSVFFLFCSECHKITKMGSSFLLFTTYELNVRWSNSESFP